MRVCDYLNIGANDKSMGVTCKNSANSAIGVFQIVMGGQNDCSFKAKCYPEMPLHSRVDTIWRIEYSRICIMSQAPFVWLSACPIKSKVIQLVNVLFLLEEITQCSPIEHPLLSFEASRMPQPSPTPFFSVGFPDVDILGNDTKILPYKCHRNQPVPTWRCHLPQWHSISVFWLESQLLHLQSHFLLKHLKRQQEDNPGTRVSTTHRETQMKFMTPGFDLAQSWLLWSFGEWNNEWSTFSPSLPLSDVLYIFTIYNKVYKIYKQMREEILSLVATWMYLKAITVLSEISHTQKDEYHLSHLFEKCDKGHLTGLESIGWRPEAKVGVGR